MTELVERILAFILAPLAWLDWLIHEVNGFSLF